MSFAYVLLLVGVILTLSNLFFSAPSFFVVLGLLIVGASLFVLVYQAKKSQS